MPIYGYECTSCHKDFEIMQSIKDEPLSTCEACGGSLKKKIYPVGISFKGSGFYVNDYAGSGPKPAAAEGTSSTTASAPESSAPATDTKTAEASTPTAPAAAPAPTASTTS